MDKKNVGTIAGVLAAGMILGSTTIGPFGLFNNENIKQEYNDAASKPIVTKADEERLERLRKYKTISDIHSYIGAFGLAAAAGAGMGALAGTLSKDRKEDNEEENVM